MLKFYVVMGKALSVLIHGQVLLERLLLLNLNRLSLMKQFLITLHILCKSKNNLLLCMGSSPSFSALFSKGDNFPDFMCAYLEYKVLLKWGLLLKERICSSGSKFFFKS